MSFARVALALEADPRSVRGEAFGEAGRQLPAEVDLVGAVGSLPAPVLAPVAGVDHHDRVVQAALVFVPELLSQQ